jgi:MFS family permease
MWLSRRWEMTFLLFSGMVIAYCLRVNMSVVAPKLMDELGWTENQKGKVLSSFFWGYTVGQLPASRITQIYGAKLTFGLAIFIPSLLTLFVPWACEYSYMAALAMRVVIGLFQSSCFPSIYHFLPKWAPSAEKTIIISTIINGIYAGEIIGFSFSGYLIDHDTFIYDDVSIGGWQGCFYLFGFIGIIWYPLWLFLAYESPDIHPRITIEELQYIKSSKFLFYFNYYYYIYIDIYIFYHNL